MAIALDATLVRLILVPAAMKLFGDWNWWMPSWLDRALPDLSFENGSPRARAEPRRRDRSQIPCPAMSDELAFAGAAKQAEMVRAGEVSPSELVQLYLERIARLDPQLNVFREVLAERALLEAEQAEARLKAARSGRCSACRSRSRTKSTSWPGS